MSFVPIFPQYLIKDHCFHSIIYGYPEAKQLLDSSIPLNHEKAYPFVLSSLSDLHPLCQTFLLFFQKDFPNTPSPIFHLKIEEFSTIQLIPDSFILQYH